MLVSVVLLEAVVVSLPVLENIVIVLILLLDTVLKNGYQVLVPVNSKYACPKSERNPVQHFLIFVGILHVLVQT